MGSATLLLGLVLWDVLRDRMVYPGRSAPDFTLTTDGGKTITPDSFGGRILVLNFWATWCPPCVKETPVLEATHRRLKDRGLVLVAVSVDKSEQKYKNFLKRFGVTYHTLRDPEQKFNDLFGTYRYPETYVIDQSGKVLIKKIGELDEDTLKQIERLLS